MLQSRIHDGIHFGVVYAVVAGLLHANGNRDGAVLDQRSHGRAGVLERRVVNQILISRQGDCFGLNQILRGDFSHIEGVDIGDGIGLIVDDGILCLRLRFVSSGVGRHSLLGRSLIGLSLSRLRLAGLGLVGLGFAGGGLRDVGCVGFRDRRSGFRYRGGLRTCVQLCFNRLGIFYRFRCPGRHGAQGKHHGKRQKQCQKPFQHIGFLHSYFTGTRDDSGNSYPLLFSIAQLIPLRKE